MQGTGAHKVLEPADQAISVSESDGSVGVGIWVMMTGKVVAPKRISWSISRLLSRKWPGPRSVGEPSVGASSELDVSSCNLFYEGSGSEPMAAQMNSKGNQVSRYSGSLCTTTEKILGTAVDSHLWRGQTSESRDSGEASGQSGEFMGPPQYSSD